MKRATLRFFRPPSDGAWTYITFHSAGICKDLLSHAPSLLIEELTMDDDVIDITHMTAEERREHYRHLNQLSTCPCVYCVSPCARNSEVAECDSYQEWREFNMH